LGLMLCQKHQGIAPGRGVITHLLTSEPQLDKARMELQSFRWLTSAILQRKLSLHRARWQINPFLTMILDRNHKRCSKHLRHTQSDPSTALRVMTISKRTYKGCVRGQEGWEFELLWDERSWSSLSHSTHTLLHLT
jgi:hypothetical protein